MTLCFLSYHPEKAIDRIVELIEAVGPRPVELRLEPEPVPIPGGRPRLFAIGAASEASVALQAELSEALERERLYKPEKRPFWPHLTVARVRSPSGTTRSASSHPCRVHSRRPAPLPVTRV